MKILVVEDETLIGMDLVVLLESWGYHADGPHNTSEKALDAIGCYKPDLAILDVNLGGDATSVPIAEVLTEAGTPYIFLTGYSVPRAIENPLVAEAPRLQKPINEHALRQLLERFAQPIS